LATDTAMWISPTGEYLAFATFNDTQVLESVILRYGRPGDLSDQYPTEVKFRYPKVIILSILLFCLGK
jgi:dipeptidyl-peptidase-4